MTDWPGNKPKYLTTLPGSPYDGQEIYYAADATNGVIWHLRYRAAASGSYKWEYVGGGKLYAEIDTAESLSATGYQDLATVGPSQTPPLSGDYLAAYGAEMWNNTNGGIANIAPAYNGAAATSTDRLSKTEPSSGNTSPNAGSRERKFTLTSGQAMTLKYDRPSGTTATFRMRWLSLVPIRVG